MTIPEDNIDNFMNVAKRLILKRLAPDEDVPITKIENTQEEIDEIQSVRIELTRVRYIELAFLPGNFHSGGS